ncbi:MAG: DUF58 domain-containing protein [Bacteroidota bacterium]
MASSAELLKKIKKIEIKSRGLSNEVFSGEYHSAFKGRGMAFSEVREYMPGDDIRTIDWNVTARLNHTFVKVFEEEREMTVMLLVDVSASGNFGTQQQTKQELITELCAVLAFSAIQNNDKIGVLFFSDKIEKFIPPKKGKSHILRIISELIEFKPENTKTDITVALKYFSNIIKRRCTAFLISDFIAPNFLDALKIASKKHDIVALQINDLHESEIPAIGLIQFTDFETNETIWIDSNDQNVRKAIKIEKLKRSDNIKDAFNRTGTDFASIYTGQSYVKPLMNLFKKREGKR